MRPNAAFEINTASICTVAYLVIRPNASKANIALITPYTLHNIRGASTSKTNIALHSSFALHNIRGTNAFKFNVAVFYFANHSVGNTAAFKRNIPRITSAIYVITCCCTTKVNITCSSNMLQICCTSKTSDSHIAPSTFIDIHEASTAVNTQIPPSIINIQIKTGGIHRIIATIHLDTATPQS
ncbi:hypothetical protein BTURTLESOX_660 [bacterium endosymbiont of Bathymodiolus sp. 5 South]|nr:hypothetical protein BTURTLESOX_660 [bacterium endosymbiont of Bathymodiolus sp. 5 South]